MVTGKTGIIRIIDVLFIGPYLINLSYQQKSPTTKLILFLIGGATILYNGINYLKFDVKE
jgi:hypothetical protein